jgi:hypothetical protein
METQLLFKEHVALGVQHVFDHVLKHLLTQMKRSANHLNDGTGIIHCLYRGPDNTSCAVGCLIADRQYNAIYEQSSIDKLQYSSKEFVVNDGIILDLLRRLQCIHDTIEPENWKESLETLAEEYDLIWNEDLYPTTL